MAKLLKGGKQNQQRKVDEAFEQIEKNQVTFVDLKKSKLNEVLALELIEVLEENHSVTKLDLSENKLGEKGVSALAKALTKHPAITHIDLRFNGLTWVAAHALLKLIKVNWKITTLLVEETATAMNEFFVQEEGRTLEPIPKKDKKAIADVLDANTRIKKYFDGQGDALLLGNRDIVEVDVFLFSDEHIGRLRKLFYEKNLIEEIPREVSKIKNLEELKISHNKLKSLPPQLGMLEKLKRFDASHNQISSIPEELGQLKGLESFKIHSNRLTDLPICLGELEELIEFTANHNPIDTIPMEYVDQGGEMLRDYLRELQEGFKRHTRMKLMIVGQENVGKTQTLMSLTGRTREPGEVHLATDGIDIQEWAVTKDIRFSAWDFAGQEVYYSTHQFFLSHRAIYLLLFNLSRPDELSRVEYWLNSITSVAKKAPIIIVGTYLDHKSLVENPERVDEIFDELDAKFSKFEPKHYLPISNRTGQNVPELRQVVEETAVAMKQEHYKNEVIPASYDALEKKVKLLRQSLNPPIKTWDEWVALAVEAGVKESGVKSATKFLTDLGVVVFFDEVDAGLADMVIMSPQWLTSMFASVVTLRHQFTKHGMMSMDSLREIWNSNDFPEYLHEKLLKLLERFEICYTMKVEDKLLLPSLLDTERPEIFSSHWNEVNTFRLEVVRLYYLAFLPQGFFGRLIIRLLHFTAGLVYWKHGCVVKNTDGDKALVQVDAESNQMAVFVRGDAHPAELFRLVIETVDNLITMWYGIECTRWIPCPACRRAGEEEPFLYQFTACETAVTDGKAYLTCETNGHQIEIDKLTPDVVMEDFTGTRIDLKQVFISKELGAGSFGKVYKGIWRDQEIAIKQLAMPDDANKEARLRAFNDFRREVWVMAALHHPCVVNLLGFSMNPFLIIMEFVACGDMYGYIHKETAPLDWDLKLKMALDMAQGMEFLHSQTPPLLHRDLKTPNVFLAATQPKALVCAKIADFGLSSRLYVPSMKAQETQDREVTNPTWLAPEVIMANRDYDEKSDVYAMGIMMWELMTREHPFAEFEELKFAWQMEEAICKGRRPTVPNTDDAHVWETFVELFRQAWDNDAAVRPSFQQITQQLILLAKTHDLIDEITVADQSAMAQLADNEQQSVGDHPVISAEGNIVRSIPVLPAFGEVSAMAYVSGRDVWVGHKTGHISIWDAKTGTMKEAIEKAHHKEILAMVFTGTEVWTGAHDGLVVWRAQQPACPEKRGELFKRVGRKKALVGVWVWLKDGHLVVFENNKSADVLQDIDLDNKLLKREARPGKDQYKIFVMEDESVDKKKKFEEEFECKDPDVMMDWYNVIEKALVWIAEKKAKVQRKPIKKFRDKDAKQSRINCMSVQAHDGRQAVWVGSVEGIVTIRDTKDFRVRKEFQLASKQLETKQLKVSSIVKAHPYVVISASRIAFCVDPIHYTQRKQFVGHTEKITRVVNAHGHLWTVSTDCTMRLWNIETGSCLKTLSGFKTPVLDVMSAGQAMWVAHARHRIRLFTTKNGDRVRELKTSNKIGAKLMLPCGHLVWIYNVDHTFDQAK